MICSGKKQTMHQFFAESIDEEADVLRAYYAEICKLDYIVTFNGKHFDIPFLQKRMMCHDMHQITMPYNLDLYLLANGFSDLRSMLPNLRQTTIENFMGLWSTRTDEISGAESVDLYFQYIKEHNTSIREKILLHNNDDVLQLHKLLKLTSKVDFHKAMFKLGFPVGGLEVTNVSLKSRALHISGIQKAWSRDYISHSTEECPYSLMFSKTHGTFEVMLPIIRKDGLAVVDLKSIHFNKSSLKSLPSCVEDFLILEKHSETDYSTINHLIKLLVSDIYKTIQ